MIQKYEACWFFEYTDGRRKKGVYNHASQDPRDAAWAQPKAGLLRAGILARCGNRVERLVCECSGQDFCNFEWVMDKSALSGNEQLSGLSVVSRNQRTTFFFDGKINILPRDTSEDKLFHFGGPT